VPAPETHYLMLPHPHLPQPLLLLVLLPPLLLFRLLDLGVTQPAAPAAVEAAPVASAAHQLPAPLQLLLPVELGRLRAPVAAAAACLPAWPAADSTQHACAAPQP
jgi:hypothetical protein